MPLQQFLFFLRYFCFANFAFQENMTFLMFSSCLNTFYSILQSVHVLLCILLIIIIIFFLCYLILTFAMPRHLWQQEGIFTLFSLL